MDIHFLSEKDRTLANDEVLLEKEMKKSHNVTIAKKVKRVLSMLRSVKHLQDYFSCGIGKPEPLKGNRKNQFSIRLDEKERMILEPSDIVSATDEGCINLRKVTSVTIIEMVGGYHD